MEREWQAEFDRYKQIPQFAKLNADMTLDGFKAIFWWEWAHRLLARVVGAAFILPALWFWWKGQLPGALGRQVAVATGLLALEPIVGWWMVTSGLSERTEVGAGAIGAASLDCRRHVRRPDLRRRRTWRRAPVERDAARLRNFGLDLRRAHLLPARSRRLVAGLRAGSSTTPGRSWDRNSFQERRFAQIRCKQSSATRRRRSSTTG